MADLTTLRDAIARTLWLSAYADAIERAQEYVAAFDEGDDTDPATGDRLDTDEARERATGLADALDSLPAAGAGEDWDDAVPNGFPARCARLADKILASMESKLFPIRARKPAVDFGFRRHGLEAHVHEWVDATGGDDDRLGHCIALQALGHGVTVDDDAPNGVRFDALRRAVPHVECYAEVTADGTVRIVHTS